MPTSGSTVSIQGWVVSCVSGAGGHWNRCPLTVRAGVRRRAGHASVRPCGWVTRHFRTERTGFDETCLRSASGVHRR